MDASVSGGAIDLVGHSRALRLETSAIERGNRSLIGASPRVAMGDDEDSILIDRGSVSERIIAHADDLEQSWHFDHRPEGEGDLVVRLHASRSSHRPSSSVDLRFGEREGAGFRYGAATFVDADRHETRLRSSWVNGEIEIRVAAAVIDHASFPALIDPVIEPEFALDPTPKSYGAYGVKAKPIIASRGVGKGTLAAWVQSTASSTAPFRITMMPVGPSGVPQRKTPLVVANAVGGVEIAAAPNAASTLLVWTVRSPSEGAVMAARIDASGAVVDTAPIAIATNAKLTGAPAVASDGTNWFVMWNTFDGSQSSVFGVRLSASGAVLDPVPLTVATAAAEIVGTAVTFDGTAYVVAYQTSATSPMVTAKHVTVDGLVSGSSQPWMLAAAGTAISSSVASDGVTVALLGVVETFDEAGLNRSTELFARRFDRTTLAPVDANAFDLGPSGNAAEVIRVDQRGYLANWANTDGTSLFASFWSAGGPPDAPTIIDSAAIGAASFLGAAVDGAFGVVLEQPPDKKGLPGFSISTARFPLSPLGRIGTLSDLSATAPQQDSPELASNGATTISTWVEHAGTTMLVESAELEAAMMGKAPNTLASLSNGDLLGRPRIAASASDFLVVFDRPEAMTQKIVGIHLDEAGNPGAAFDISAPPNPGDYAGSPDVSFDGANYLVVWSQINNGQDTIVARRVAVGAPTLLDAAPIIVRGPDSTRKSSEAAVGSDGQTSLVAWTERIMAQANGIDVAFTTHIFGRRLSPTGLPVEGIQTLTDGFLSQSAPRVAGNRVRQGFLVVWEDFHKSNSERDVYAARVGADGSLPDRNASLLVAGGNYDESAPHVTVSPEGTNFIATWNDLRSGTSYDISSAWISPDGRNHDADGGISIASTSVDESNASIVAAGPGRAVVSYERFVPDDGFGTLRAEARFVALGAPSGTTCTTGDVCESRDCVDGFCCTKLCDGCLVCNGAASPGTCTPAAAGAEAPRCPLNRCRGDATCPSDCNRDEDCTAAATCDVIQHRCVVRTVCIDRRQLKDISGVVTDCAPYACDGFACKQPCASVDDCQSGFACDFSGRCVSTADRPDTGGCAIGSEAGLPSLLLPPALVALLACTRRRRSGAASKRSRSGS